MTFCEHTQAPKQTLFRARDYVTGDSFSIQRCPTCGLVFTQPVPSTEAIGRYYPEAYYGDPSRRRFPGPVEVLQQWLYAYRAWQMGKWVKDPNRRVLDIGCGKGFLLDAFRQRGWTVQGVELSEHSARHGREILGLKIHVGALSDEAMVTQRFEAAVLWHVLEHAQDPGRFLAEVHQLLVPGGMLLVSVPDFGSPEARFCTSNWFHLDVPRHLVHFTRGTLSHLLEEAGFKIVVQIRFTPEFDLFSFIQSALNTLGLPYNHLYRLLRGQGAKFPDSKRHWLYALATYGLSIPLGLVGLVWVLIVGWLGYGSAMTYLVRKERD